jgi:hypothetical protein
MKKFAINIVLIAANLLILCGFVSSEEEKTTTQTSNAINLYPQKCGVSIVAERKWLIVNDNDDNVDEKWDMDVEPISNEKDTIKITVTRTADKSDATVTVSIIEGPEHIDGFWPGTLKVDGAIQNAGGQTEAALEKSGKEKNGSKKMTFTVPAGKTAIQTLYVEGILHSDTLNDVKISAKIVAPEITIEENGVQKKYKACETTTDPNVELTVYQVDLDVDSNNNNAFDFANFDKPEDEIEASEKSPKKPGKYVFVNAGFSANDNEAAPGWGDGFEVGGAAGVVASTSIARDAKFTPVQIELKEPFDPAKAKIKFVYSAADPKLVTKAAGGGTPSDSFTYSLGVSDKHLRIWKKDFTTTRNKKNVDDSGDYVQDNKDMDWSKIASGRKAQIFLEGIKPSTALGDLSIEVIITENGITTNDKVNITSVYFKDATLAVTANAGAAYSLFNNAFVATSGPAVNYEVSNKFQPDGVDCSVEPLLNKRAAIMQNVVSDQKTYNLHNLQPAGPIIPIPTWPAPGFVDLPVTGSLTMNLMPPRVNDSADFTGDPNVPAGIARNWKPIYAVFDPIPSVTDTMGNILGRPLNCSPAGKPTKSHDTPTAAFVVPIISYISVPQPAGAPPILTPVFVSVYNAKRIQMQTNFMTWSCGYDVGNKICYPLSEITWSLNIDTDIVGPQSATVAATSSAPTLVPVRSPYANEVGASALTPPNGFPIVPTPGATVIRVP